jgi:hypothetical protein
MKYTEPRRSRSDFYTVLAVKMSVVEVREKFPRFDGVCPDCGAMIIVYVSYLHYLYGDW